MKKALFVLLLPVFLSTVYSQSKRVVGYLPSYHFDASDEIEFCKLTHVNLAFANPDASGNLVMEDISQVMTAIASQNPDAKVFLSVAGGQLDATLSQYWSDRIDDPQNRAEFIDEIVNYVVANNLDGVDVDLEWDNVTSGYSDFILGLDSGLTASGKQLSAALPNDVLFSNISADALAAFDFINVMSYDATGPWDPSNAGQHSSYSFAQSGIDFWTQTVQLSQDKINLGVPFYGYDFVNATTVNEFMFSEIVQMNSANADLDQVGNAFYNGRTLIAQKTELAMNETGGIMIWDLGEDSFGEYSLLTAIHERINTMNIPTTGLCGNILSAEDHYFAQKELYPNPVVSDLIVPAGAANFAVFSVNGEILKKGSVANGVVSFEDLSAGYYFLVLDGKNYPVIKK